VGLIKEESEYTIVSLFLLIVLAISMLINFIPSIPLSMSRLGWLVITSISFFLAAIGKKKTHTLVSNFLMYLSLLVLCLSLVLFKTILPIIKMVLLI